MRPSTAGILPLFAVLLSCGSSAPKRTGNAEKDLDVKRTQDGVCLLVGSKFDRFVLQLPYADDWTFQTSADNPLFGTSAKAPMTASVQIWKPGKKLDEEGYLWNELFQEQKAALEKRGIAVKAGETYTLKQAFGTDPPHWALEFRTESAQLRQVHYWSLRQNREGTAYLLHLSTSAGDDPRLVEIRSLAQMIAMEWFKIVD